MANVSSCVQFDFDNNMQVIRQSHWYSQDNMYFETNTLNKLNKAKKTNSAKSKYWEAFVGTGHKTIFLTF